MTLIESLVDIFKEEATNVFRKEAENDSYLKQNWLGTTWRAFKGLMTIYKKAFPRQLKVLAYAIAKHRLEKHGEDKQVKVMNRQLRSMTLADQEKAESESTWWVNE